MSGYANSLNFGMGQQPLGFSPQAPTSPQVAAYTPMSYADTMNRFGSSSPQLSFGSGFTGDSGSNASGGFTAVDSTGLGGRPYNASNVGVPDVGNAGDAGKGFTWGGALDGFKTLSSIIGTFGQIYSGIQMNKIAKDQLAFSKESYAENLKNQKKAYNNSSEARSRSAGVQNNWSDAEVSAHIAKRAM